jgi:hypothetical protein
MKILVVAPLTAPVVKEIDGTLKSMQEVVGGYIEALYPFNEAVALICNEEGKLLGLPFNRALRDEDGVIYDIVAGTFFLCAAPPYEENFTSLTDDEIERFAGLFLYPEIFLM